MLFRQDVSGSGAAVARYRTKTPLELLVDLGQDLLYLFLGQAELRRLRHGQGHAERKPFRHRHQRVAGDARHVAIHHRFGLGIVQQCAKGGIKGYFSMRRLLSEIV